MWIIKKIIGRLIKATSAFLFALAVLMMIYYIFFSEEELRLLNALLFVPCFPLSFLVYRLGYRFDDKI